MKPSLVTIIGLLAFHLLQAQTPSSHFNIPIDEVEVYQLPPVDNAALEAREMSKPRKGRAIQFAQPFDTDLQPHSHGTWEVMPNGRAVWRLRIQSEGAVSLNFGFTQYDMPNDGELYIYSKDGQKAMGPFNHDDNEVHDQLWTPILEADECVVEVNLPAESKDLLGLTIGKVNHGFLDARAMRSGSCNVDVVCSEEDGLGVVDGYRDIIRSAAIYSINGSYTCSGSLLNNVRQDCTPFFLGANHCGVSSTNAPSIVVYWNFENSYCRAPNSAASGGPGDGNFDTYNTGSVYRAGYASSDFFLLELDDPVNETANAFFAGWSREDIAPTSAIAIHHPSLDEKRISFEDDPCEITTYSNYNPVPNGTHIRIIDWDLGTTEGGSSGSPLYDQNKRIVGQLHGGGASCGNDESDWYGRIAASWEGGGTSSSRLRDWLDPEAEGVMYIDGKEATVCGTIVEVSPPEQSVCAGEEVSYDLYVSEGFTGLVSMSLAGLPDNANANLSANPAMPGSTATLTISTDGVALGDYQITLAADGLANSSETVFNLMVFDGIPGMSSLVNPADGAEEVNTYPDFSWTDSGATSYDFEVATDPGFANVVATGNVTDTIAGGVGLEIETAYYWRVKAGNDCGVSEWSEVYSFTTGSVGCETLTNESIVTMDEFTPGEYTSTIIFPHTGSIVDVDVLDIHGSHEFLGDLDFSITSPAGNTVVLLSSDCEIGSPSFNISFDDAVDNAAVACPFEDGTVYQPVDSLSIFNGEDAEGIWTLGVNDVDYYDGGVLQGWKLRICYVNEASPNRVWSGSAFRIYPNPSRGALHIDLSHSGSAKGEVFSTDGRSVREFDVRNGQAEMYFGGLAKGMYIIRVTDEYGSRTEKWVLE